MEGRLMSDVAEKAQIAAAGHLLERARWAANAFGDYSSSDVSRIVSAVAEAAYASARRYAEWAVRETGFGVVEDKVRKNEACSRGIVEYYASDDFVSPRLDLPHKIVEVPRPAGVVLALTPSTNPIATLYFKVLLGLMTRNAVLISPHPLAKACCADAADELARAATDAGAPDGIIQVVREPTIPLVESLMADDRTNVILATGGIGVVRAAYGSGNPAIGVGPGNVPVLVDGTADIAAAARLIVESKAFDNSVLCTNESVLIVQDSVADRLASEMQRAGAAILDRPSAERLSEFMFPHSRLNVDVVGKSAGWIAQQAGLRVDPKAKVLVAPFEVAVPEEPLTHEKLSPVLGMIRVTSADRGIETARAVVRIAGAGHSAAIHSNDAATVMRYAARVPVLRVAVNVGNSTGSSGLDTNLAPSMTIGTGFVGRSSLGENLQPKHLLNWTRIAYNAVPGAAMPDFANLSPWHERSGSVPAYPVASNDQLDAHGPRRQLQGPAASANGVPVEVSGLSAQPVQDSPGHVTGEQERFRAEIRRLVLDELSQLMKG
jgi:acyl-CoA reductase-like NAD-dependent aldehyde dehydrogenase